jgi:hypothetical protein
MRAITNSRRRSQFVWLQTVDRFRVDDTVIGRGPTIFLTTFPNHLKEYKLITVPLATATHKLAVATIDSQNNYSSYISGAATVGPFTMPPRFTAFVYAGTNAITISWTKPSTGNPDSYRIYSNGGSGSINYGSTYATPAGTATSYSATGLTTGTWYFQVEAVKSGVQSDTDFILKVVVPRTVVPPPPPVDADKSIETINAENVTVGKLKISFMWLYGTAASQFRIYHDNGTGTIDYAHPITFSRTNGFKQTYTSPQLCFLDGKQTYKFVVRSVSSDGVEDTNTVEHEVTLDGVAPEDVEDLTVGNAY